jgi:predicted enzyme related to lactoylglutathione lyase
MSENTAAEQAMTMPENGEFCWTEFATDNFEACKTFYTEVFGWQYKNGDVPGAEMQYLEFSTDGKKLMGGLFEMKPEWYGGEAPAPHKNVYIAVTDVDETASRAFDLGGTILSPPADIPNVGRFCQIKDPTGAEFFIITLKR